MHGDVQKVMLSEEEIADKVFEMGAAITADYEGKQPIIISVLKGSVVFVADLIRAIETDIEIDFMVVSSYAAGTESSGQVQMLKDVGVPLMGRHVLIVEDILDSGLTLSYLKDQLLARDLASLRIATLLDKPSRRKSDIKPDYVGFTIPDEFVVGYGLDYAEKYRNLPYIGVLKPDVYGGE